jgi:hypothetical protein
VTLTVDGLRDFIETSLDDTSLGLYLDAAYEAIDAILGPAGYDDSPSPVTEVVTGVAGPLLMLAKPAESITLIVEQDTELAQDDYELIGNQLVRRLSTGTNPRTCWYGRVMPTYQPVSDVNTRDRAAIALVQLDLNHEPGVASERLGDHAISFGSADDYTRDRAAILASLSPTGFMAK